MKTALVGYTGFVGSNIAAKHDFDFLFNSTNIEEAFGLEPDLLVYSGVRAEKFLANKDPEADYNVILNAIENIKKIAPKKLVLISTIDVYKRPVNVDEDSEIDTDDLHAYGLNRYKLEEWVRNNIDDHLIIRLPGLFGINIKKNFIYDFINVLPSMLTEAKLNELSAKEPEIDSFFEKQDNGFYKCMAVYDQEKTILRTLLQRVGFSAVQFTDSRASFQFYNLAYLWANIETALDNNIQLLNISSEPITISEIYTMLTGKNFVNEVAKVVPSYDYKSKHATVFNGEKGYLFTKDSVMTDIKDFIESNK